MKKSLLTLVAIVFSAFLETVSFAQNALYWEDYSPEKQNAIISSDSLDPLVSAYYYGEKQPSDDEDTFSFLEILASRTDQDDRRALFFHLLNRVALKADGALAESMGYFQYRILINYPQYVFEYLCGNQECRDCYVWNLGYILSWNPEGEGLNKELLKMNEHVGAKIDPALKEKWQQFMAAILVEIENCD